MMKKQFLLIITALISICQISCDKADSLDSAKDFGNVNIKVGISNAIYTKAISDGKTVDCLMYAVFAEDGELVLSKSIKSEINNLSNGYEMSVTLPAGNRYKAVFWAQNGACKAFNVSDDMIVDVDYTGANNDETMDAFFGVTELFSLKDSEVSVTLKRPFAQVNVGAFPFDWEYAKEFHKLEATLSGSKISGVPNTLNLLTGEVSGSTDVEFAAADMPSENLMVDVDCNGINESYTYLSMSYILASDEYTSHAMSFTFADKFGYTATLNKDEEIDVRRNYRTNIVGQVLTDNGELDIVFDSMFIDKNTISYRKENYVEFNIKSDTVLSNTVFNLEGYNGGLQFGSANGELFTLNDVSITGNTWVIELGQYRGASYVNYNNLLNNVVVKDLSVSSGIECHHWYFSPAVIAYGNSEINNCIMKGTTTVKEPFIDSKGNSHPYIPVDLGIRNESDAVIKGGEYGTVFAWTHAVVEIYDTKIGTLYCGTCDSTPHSWMTIGKGTRINKVRCCEPRKPYGSKEYSTTMTIKDGAYVGELELVSTDVEFLIIEPGAYVGKIICEGVEYTYQELRSAMGL